MKNLKKILNSVLVVFLISTQFNFLFAQQNLPSKHIELGSEINVVDTQEKNYVEGEIIVKFRPAEINLKSSSSKNLLNTFEINNDLQSQDTITTDNIAVMKIENNQSVEQKLAELQSDPNVEYAQPNYIYHILSDDPLSGNLWGLPQIKWNEAMSIFSGTSSLVTGTIVAVIDMGVFYNHPDLINKMRDGSACKSDTGVSLSGCIHGYDYRDDDKDPSPIFNDHGTHVAGTIGAQMDNGIGIMGVNPQAQIMTIRAGEGGDLNSVTIIRGINFAKYNGAKIINASFGSTDYDTGTKTAIDNFPGLFIAAAGNAGSNNDTTQVYPCNYLSDNIICVAATDQSDDLSWFSNYGSQSVDLGAPGTYIHSTVYTTGISLLEGFTGSTLGEVPSGWTTGGTTNNRGVLNIGGSLGNVLFSDINLPYANNTNSSIEIGQDLSSYAGASISFETICDTEYTDSRADYMSLEISADGITYTGLNLFMPYGANDNKRNEWTLDDDLDSNNNGILSGTYAELYSSIPTSYLTSNFKIKFNRTSNSSDNNYNGCLVDNIKIEGHTSSYGDKHGTSMAAPHVAGLASLAWSASPSLTYNQIKNIIINNGDSLSALSGKTVSGKRINAQKTLEALNYVSLYSSVGQSLSGGGISNNLHTIINSAMSGNVNNFSGLYFAKMSGSTELGRITFATGLDLTDPDTQDFLSGDLSTSIGISQGKIRFTPGSGFENKNARLQMNLPTSFSGIVGYINSGSFIVREGNGGAVTGNSMITSVSTGNCIVTGGYCPIYINVLHFTSFELKPQLIKVNIKSNNTKNTSYAKSGDLITLSFTGSETLASVSATINGFTGVVTGSTLSRYTTFTVTGGTANTGIVFSINYQNLSGATGNTVISTTDGSAVRVDNVSPVLSGAASVSNTGTQTPSYSFTSSEAGTISYGSGCTSSTTTAILGTNNITFSTMSNATYAGCRIYVSDNAANQSYIIVPTFTVNYTAGGGGGGGGGGDTNDDLPSCKLSDVVCIDGEYEIDGNVDCVGGYLGDACDEEEDILEDTAIDEGDISGSPFDTTLNDAYLYAYQIGITTMSTIHKANMTGTLQRSHLAKMIVNYATEILNKQADTSKTCNFSDIGDQTTELRGYIKTACQMGLMGVGLNTFYPKNKVTRAEFGTILSRALRGNDNNQSGQDYYSKHLKALKTAGIMTQISFPGSIEIRGYVMLMLMRAEDKQ